MFDVFGWRQDWWFGIAMTITTVVVHVVGLSVIYRAFDFLLAWFGAHARGTVPRGAMILGPTVALTFLLHAMEAAMWGICYVILGAAPDFHMAVLYSLGAMSTFGHAAAYLAPDWQLLGAVQAFNGMLIFGLSTAFLSGVVRRVWNDAPF